MKATENTWFSVAFDESTECGRDAYERLDALAGQRREAAGWPPRGARWADGPYGPLSA